VSGINFYRTRDGHLARKKSRLDKKKWLRDPAFKGQREASRILGEGAKAYKLLKLAFHPYMAQAADSRQAGRASALFGKIIRLDATSLPEERQIMKENLHLLRNWEGNKDVFTDSVLSMRPKVELNRSVGTVSITMPEYSAKRDIKSPAGTTHYQLVTVAASIDFTTKKYQQDAKESEWLPVSASSAAATSLNLQLTADTELPVLVGMGIRFAQKVNEREYLLNNRQYNVFKVMEVFA
jgi:hypothetical protein